MASEAYRVTVTGRVQGVAFRYHARERAVGLGVTGWVRNRSDGRVEAHVEGAASAVQEMLAWLAHGPRFAHVSGVERRPVPAESSTEFEIRPSV